MKAEHGGPTIPTENNFDMIRFVLAAMVFVAHAHDLSGLESLAPLSALISSTLAVQAFFVISGFLIFQSYERSRSIKSYAEKRIRRIFPAYFTIVMICGICLAGMSELTITKYFVDHRLLNYLLANIVFLNFIQPDLPGVFTNNIINAVNGALWTLKIEVLFYVTVPICVWLFAKANRLMMIIVIYFAAVIYAYVMVGFYQSTGKGLYYELSRQLPAQMSYFIAGAAIYYYYDKLIIRGPYMLLAGLAIFALSTLVTPLAIRPLAVALCVMGLAFGPYLGRFGRYGDFSYGIYIVHFPILQTLIALGLPDHGAVLFFVTSATLVLASSVLMWHFVEKRFLRRDSHYRIEAARDISAVG